MTITEQLTSLGATVLQSDVSFCDLHNWPVGPVFVAAVLIVSVLGIAATAVFCWITRDMFLPVPIFLSCAAILLGATLVGLKLTTDFFDKPSEYTIEVSEDTDMTELTSNFKIISDQSAYPIFTVTPK